MCTFNGAKFLAEQLQSIALQTLQPGELIVCDDGSTDGTVGILQSFSLSAPFPVRIFCNQVTLGPAKNFEQAIGLCEREIIALCDQDDVWKPEKLARLEETLDRQPEAAYAFSDAGMIAEGGTHLGTTVWDAVGLLKKVDRFVGGEQLRVLLRHNLIAGCSMAFRASFRDIFLPIPPTWMHDYWIVLLGSALFQGAPVPERLYMYRRHAGQVCGLRMKTFSQVVSTSVGTDQEDCWKKVEQFRGLLNRLATAQSSYPCEESRLNLLRQKEMHLLRRATVRSSKGISRLFEVLAEASTGRYHRFSNSWYSIVRDL
jgi:glycosyltransferase involved in cell wall biosynthesis